MLKVSSWLEGAEDEDAFGRRVSDFTPLLDRITGKEFDVSAFEVQTEH